MNKIIVFVLSSIFAMVGCSQKNQEIKEDVSEKITTIQENETKGEYDEYLLLMSDSQRARFFKLDTEVHKERFLQAEGIYRKKELNESLVDNMSTQEVAGLLGQANDKETNIGEQEVRWTFVEFNNYRNMKYTLTFKNDSLASWYFWLD